MDTASETRRGRALWIIVIVGTLALFYGAIQLFAGRWSSDLSALYMAALAVAEGLPDAIYDAPTDVYADAPPPRWEALLASIGQEGRVVFPYLYPPLWAHLLAPVTQILGPLAFFQIVFVMHLMMLAAAPALGWGLTRPGAVKTPDWLLVGLVLLATSAASLNAVIQNQAQITVTFLVLLAFFAYSRRFWIIAGVILGLAAALKLSPAFLGLLFLRDRNWRAIGAMALTGGALLLLSVLLAGLEAHRVWLARLDVLDRMSILSMINYSPEMLLYQLQHWLTGAPGKGMGYDSPLWVQLLPKALLLFGLFVIGLRRNLPMPVALLALSTLVALLGPLSWMHYFLLPMMLFPALFLRFEAQRAWALIALGGVILSFPLYVKLRGFQQPLLMSALVPTLYFCALTVALLIPRKT